MTESVQIHKGLEGIVADTTAISLVDGEAGRLIYRGYSVESLVDRRFAEVLNLIVFGELPDAQRLEAVEEYLWVAGRLPPELAASLRELARHGEHPMITLQGIVPLLALEPPAISLGRTAEEEEGLIVAARLPAAIAVVKAALQDHPEHPYPQSRRYGERFLQLLHGRTPSAEEVSTFEAAQILQIDHGFNASTFTARVVTSTLAPVGSALSAAMGALFGPLHGAADQQALEMAMEVGNPADASAFVANCLATGRRVMGMGHRVYKVKDPRATVLQELAENAFAESSRPPKYDLAVELEKVAAEVLGPKGIYPNVDFYSGVVYSAIGIPTDVFTPIFAIARVSGWLAHWHEQLGGNRICRPEQVFTGKNDQKYVPLSNRKN